MFKSLSIFLFCIALSSAFAQDNSVVLSEIGSEKITASEFKFRYELSPFVSHKNGWNKDSLKADFLYSMIAEKLWYLEALDRGLDQTEIFKFYFNPLRDIYLRDALFKKEVESAIIISPDDITYGIFKAGRTLKTTALVSKDSSLINEFHSLISKKTVSVDSILKLPRFASIAQNPFEVELGTLMDEEVENLLFSLKPGEFTSPINSEAGRIIFLIKDIISKPLDLTNSKTSQQIKQKIKERRAMHRTRDYMRELTAGITINIDEKSFRNAGDAIFKVLSRSVAGGKPASDSTRILTDSEFAEVKTILGEEGLKQPLFSLKTKTVTVWDFLANLAFEEHRFSPVNKKALLQKLNRVAKDFVQQQILTAEAEKQGLEGLPQVQKEFVSWKQNILSQMLKVSFLDSTRVSDQEIEEYYRKDVLKDKDFLLVNLQLITVNNLEEIETILNSTGKEKSFDQIVRGYGKTDPLVDESGETGLKPAIFLGDIGIIAAKLDLNQLYGPIKRGDGYSLLMVKEKKSMNDSLKIDFDNSKELLRGYLFQKKLNEFISKKTVQLSAKYNAKAYENRLKDIKTTDVVMFVHRLMGFGGRISGVPLLDNWADFIDIKELKRELIP
ncbi:MAG: hypothetical protein LCH52_01215 [Bacteroidetes bacterium]|nr:hypothetical protein [Bacteroidota bacterium]